MDLNSSTGQGVKRDIALQIIDGLSKVAKGSLFDGTAGNRLNAQVSILFAQDHTGQINGISFSLDLDSDCVALKVRSRGNLPD